MVLQSSKKEGGENNMMNNGIVNIHGKEYMTVARRVELAHEGKTLESVETEVLSHDPVVVKAKITIKGKTFTGISSVSLESTKVIDKQNPYEVAETSAVGRALGFAGYGLIESIASADEMYKSAAQKAVQAELVEDTNPLTCAKCGAEASEKRGTSKTGRPYRGIFCSTEDRSHTQWLFN